MLIRNPKSFHRRLDALLNEEPKALKGTLWPIAEEVLSKKRKLMELARKHPTPFYVLDPEAIRKSVREFLLPFQAAIPRSKAFFAIKSNPHPELLKRVVKLGMGFDASSERELALALKLGAQNIVLSGPGKGEPELKLALAHNDRVIVHCDSFGELDKLLALSKQLKKMIRIGVRVTLPFQGKWSKFGIPLEHLAEFWKKASSCPTIQIQGIQIHMSWNSNAEPYQKAIRAIAQHLKDRFSSSMLRTIRFVDLGGGFLPHRGEGYRPSSTAQGEIIESTERHFGLEPQFKDVYYLSDNLSLKDYAQGIAHAIKTHLDPLVSCDYYFEPGRVICHKTSHIVMRIADVKNPRLAILDGGINSVGYNRFEEDYFPLINLTHPAAQEIPCRFYGNLCTPRDLWGTACYAERLEPGDVLVVPYQGAYAYTLAQNFIKPIPETYILK